MNINKIKDLEEVIHEKQEEIQRIELERESLKNKIAKLTKERSSLFDKQKEIKKEIKDIKGNVQKLASKENEKKILIEEYCEIHHVPPTSLTEFFKFVSECEKKEKQIATNSIINRLKSRPDRTDIKTFPFFNLLDKKENIEKFFYSKIYPSRFQRHDFYQIKERFERWLTILKEIYFCQSVKEVIEKYSINRAQANNIQKNIYYKFRVFCQSDILFFLENSRCFDLIPSDKTGSIFVPLKDIRYELAKEKQEIKELEEEQAVMLNRIKKDIERIFKN